MACGRLRHQVVKCCGVESIEFFVSDVENSMDFFLILYSYLSRGSFFSRSARDDQHILYSGRRGVCGCAPFRLRSASMHCLHEVQSRLVSPIVAPRKGVQWL